MDWYTVVTTTPYEYAEKSSNFTHMKPAPGKRLWSAQVEGHLRATTSKMKTYYLPGPNLEPQGFSLLLNVRCDCAYLESFTSKSAIHYHSNSWQPPEPSANLQNTLLEGLFEDLRDTLWLRKTKGRSWMDLNDVKNHIKNSNSIALQQTMWKALPTVSKAQPAAGAWRTLPAQLDTSDHSSTASIQNQLVTHQHSRHISRLKKPAP